jgi:hypothetical protein
MFHFEERSLHSSYSGFSSNCGHQNVAILAAWRSGHRVRIPPGYKVFKENTAVLLCIKWFNMHCLCVEKEK